MTISNCKQAAALHIRTVAAQTEDPHGVGYRRAVADGWEAAAVLASGELRWQGYEDEQFSSYPGGLEALGWGSLGLLLEACAVLGQPF